MTKLTPTMLMQLFSYCQWADEKGVYYGNKKQFQNRHDEIVKFLKEVAHLMEHKNWVSICDFVGAK